MKNAEVYDDECGQIIQKISDKCLTYKRLKKTPPKPVVCMPKATKFNEFIAMDLKIFKPGIYLLHVIDLFMRFSLAKVITRKLPSVIFDTFITMWIGSGLGAPGKILVDNGGEFANEEYKDRCENFNIMVCHTAAESPWQNGICERNHCVVDNCVIKILEEEPNIKLETALAWAVNAKNALQNHDGFSPYQLVYGQNPNLPSVAVDKPPALEGTTVSNKVALHLNALHLARKAYIKSETSERIRQALKHQIRNTSEVFSSGDSIYFKREDNLKWKGPDKVIGQDGKVVFIRYGDQLVRVPTCRLVKVGEEFQKRPAMDVQEQENKNTGCKEKLGQGEESFSQNDKEDDIVETVTEDKHSEQNRNSDLNNNVLLNNWPKINDTIKFRMSDFDEWKEGIVISRGGKATGKNNGYFNMQNPKTGCVFGLNLQQAQYKVINNDEFMNEVNVVFIPEQYHKDEFVIDAKQRELDSWKKFEVYTEVEDKGQMTLSTRWIITEKTYPGGNTDAKARLVVRGFEETDKLQSDSPTAHKATLRVFLSVISNQQWNCESIDVKSAFLQGKRIERDVFVLPPPDIRVEGIIWKLHKVVYGLGDASRNWYFSVRDELIKLGCTQSKLDKALFCWYSEEKLQGIFVMHVDDFMIGGSDQFKKEVINKIVKKFKIGNREICNFKYVGLHIEQVLSSKKNIVIQQNNYIDTMTQIQISAKGASEKYSHLNDKETRDLREVIGQLNWICTQTRPDISYDVLELSMATKHPQVEHLLKANKIVKKAKGEQYAISFPVQGSVSELKIYVYFVASYANLPDGFSSAGGHFIFLMGADKQCCPLTCSAHKIKRVVKSTLSAETLSMVDSLDEAIYLGTMLSQIYFKAEKNNIPIVCFTDNKSLYDSIHSTKLISEKRLRIDIASIQEMLSDGSVQAINWISTDLQYADCLTKRGVCTRNIIECLRAGHLDY